MIAEKMTSLEVLSSHPKVHLLAQHLLIPPRSEGKDGIREKRDITIAGLRLFWSVAKYHVREGVIHDADLTYIDAVVDYPGFGQAMEKVGWVKYDKRRNCLLLPEMKGEQQKTEVRKSQAALRQQRYRMRLKVRNWIVEGKKAAAELVNNSRIKNQEVVITHDMAYDEEGGLLKFGSITVDGKTMYVGYDSPQHRATDKHGRPYWASDVSNSNSGVTQSVTDSATPGDFGVTGGVTLCGSRVTPGNAESVTVGGCGVTLEVAESVTLGDSSVTPGVTDSVTVGAFGFKDSATPGVSDVTQGVTHHVTLVDSGVTQSVTQLVPNGDSDVTQSVTNSVTVGDSGVTPGVTKSVTHSDSGVAREVAKSVTHVGSGVTPGIP